MSKVFDSGFKVNTLNILANCVKEGSVNGIKINVSGARKLVKDFTGLGTGAGTKIFNAVKKTYETQMKNAFKQMEWIKILVNVAVDFATSVIECLLGLISQMRIIINTLVSGLYALIQTADSVTVRAILTPIIDPFAWIIGFIVDFGFDLFDWMFDVKDKLGDVAEWIAKQSGNFVSNAFKQITKGL